MTELFISHLLKRLRTISEVDGSFSVVDLPRWIYKGLHTSVCDLRLPNLEHKMANNGSQSRSTLAEKFS